MKQIANLLSVFVLSFWVLQSCSHKRFAFKELPLYAFNENVTPRWVSFENIAGQKGAGGKENNGAKGHPFDRINAGESKVLLDIEGPGIINRIWITIQDRSPEMLRGLVIRMYWDGEDKPAVEAPFGDFFGIGLGKTAVFENVLFSNPEGRSFNSVIQMPFRESAKIEVVNEWDQNLDMIFYDVDLQLIDTWDDRYMYFHTFWYRDTLTTLGHDFEILPKVEGKGRFLGTNIGVQANPIYQDTWWGEGEVKLYIDGDGALPTMVGTGTEDYIGTAWGQGAFHSDLQGSPIAADSSKQWCFYRYHIPDAIYFKEDLKVTIQQMGGTFKKDLRVMQNENVPLWPVSIQDAETFVPLFVPGTVVDLDTVSFESGWTNFYRQDDVSATAYFYLDQPSSNLSRIQNIRIRQYNLDGTK